MKIHNSISSPQAYARTVGFLELLVITTGIIAQMGISGKLIVTGNAMATANNILAHKELFQMGFTLYLIEMTLQIASSVLIYVLLKPANRNIALLALVFTLTGTTIKTLSRLFYIAPLLVLEDPQYLGVFNAEQLQALTHMLLKINDQAAGLALSFFGFSTVLNGYLITRSMFLPRFLGFLLIVGGAGWLAFLYPPLGNQYFPVILLLGLIGNLSQIVWFLARGVNVEKWREASLRSAGAV